MISMSLTRTSRLKSHLWPTHEPGGRQILTEYCLAFAVLSYARLGGIHVAHGLYNNQDHTLQNLLGVSKSLWH